MQKLLADELPVLWLLEMDFPTIYRCNVKNLVTTGDRRERRLQGCVEGVTRSDGSRHPGRREAAIRDRADE